MADLTLFELHVHDGLDFSPSSVIGGGADDAAEAVESAGDGTEIDIDGDEESGSGAGRAVGALIGLVFLVLAGVAVRKLMSDDLDAIEELEEMDETVEA
ncbi:hypothetical protein [Halobaculum lipolyticum]|uniref:Uncharacterized protein n=1 Tax=Halobaculum lipolyticum TaxID=3032001 RepID=A0ABD5W8P8_9EURY|nr:hypothetical protein [Halobaculum sp. DT31]